jgi:aryl-alcohol dehydrogenase
LQVTAAVVEAKHADWHLETLELADPAPDEVIVRVVASGICQTDVHGRDDYFGIPFPCVFGHEGAGVVERVGVAVRKVAPGDRVLMASPACGDCPACRRGLPGYCAASRRIKFGGRLRDGRAPFHRNALPVYGAFFQQSSFATHALATEGNVVTLPRDLLLELAAAFPCGVNTGAGAVFNVLRPQPGASFAVFGAGAVGLAGLMAARIAGCDTIIAVDLHDKRLQLARELGATHVCNPAKEDPVAAIRRASNGGVECSLEAAGAPQALRQAVDCLAPMGLCCLVGSARKGVEAGIEMTQLQQGRTLRGCIQGDAPPAQLFPVLFEHWRSGRMPVDRLITYYHFADINRAVADSLSGRSVKAVLRIGSAIM